jgi:hypothetical protein
MVVPHLNIHMNLRNIKSASTHPSDQTMTDLAEPTLPA